VSDSDTIAAIATAPGRGGIGVVRVSGPAVPAIALALLGRLPAARQATLATFADADGAAIDTGLALYFPAPASFTGEAVLELHGHGGVQVLDLLQRRLLGLGCRSARAGEFSERAYLNGKLDLAQAEAIADLIDAGSAAAARAAVRSLQGEFSARIRTLQAQITALRIHVEADIDFPDEDVDVLSGEALRTRLADLTGAFEAIAAAAAQGVLLREGLTVVIAGKPNAGKSSLLNRLAGEEVAIVTPVPGTTRDVLRTHVQIDGLPLTLLDTAGLRLTEDVVEAEGVRRARVALENADHILYVIDAASPDAAVDAAAARAELPPAVPVTLVFNKIDALRKLPQAATDAVPAPLCVSAKTGAGLDELFDELKAAAGFVGAEGALFSARRRHLDALARARALLEQAVATLRDTRAVELFAEDLRLAQAALGEITGEFGSDDLLGEIFASFCIGK
jgi:tRNA modification GTPase